MDKTLKIEDFGAIFDAHVHTYFDYHDGLFSPETLVKCTKKARYNWVNAMSHDTARGGLRVEKIAKKYGLPCIRGIEISTIHNHLLAFGIQEWPFMRDTTNPEHAIEELRKQDCAIFISHPYAPAGAVRHGVWSPEILKHLDIDGIEWFNATTYHFNFKTHAIYKNFPEGRRIAGTDSHHPSTFGHAYTQVAINSEDPDDLVKAMQKGKCHPCYRHVPLALGIYTAMHSIVRNKILKRKKIEGRWVIAEGNRPGSIVPEYYGGPVPGLSGKIADKEKNNYHEKWLKNILQSPINSRTAQWL